MKKFLLTAVLALSVAAAAQDASSQGAGAAQGQSGQKTIKDTAEYNAYMSAIGQQDPNAKAQALESFLQQYPSSVVKEDALNGLLGAYQGTNNVNKLQDVANRVLQVNPNNYRALAILVYLKIHSAQPDIPGAAKLAETGLAAIQTKPADVSDADWEKTKAGLTSIFQGAIGANYVAQKNYAAAQKPLQEAVNANPNDLSNVFPLAQAYLIPSVSTKMIPGKSPVLDATNAKNGLWYAARSVGLAQTQSPGGVAAINQFGSYYFKKYHGGDDGWQQLVQAAAASPMPAAGLLDAITPAPPPPTKADFAKGILAKNPDVPQLAYEDWLFILGSGYQEGADQVWNYLKDKVLPVKGMVISATTDTVTLATTDDDKQDKKADVTIQMVPPLKTPPAVGSEVDYKGKATSYTPDPLMIQLTEGKDAKAKTAPARTTPKKGTGTTRRAPAKKK
jgi:tetratricopeptide (TPR) repeat protein